MLKLFFNILIFTAIYLSNFPLCSQPAQLKTINETKQSNLFVGEEIKHVDGFPSLVKFIKGDPNKPLIVFIPGNSHLARIFYGFPGANEKDFLAYWIHKMGYPFLAISYPIGNAVYDKAYPNYGIQNWSKSNIDITREIIQANHLSNKIIVVAWSMAGELVQSINAYAEKNNIKIDLFVAFSGGAPLYNLSPTGSFVANLKPDENGLANTKIFSDLFLGMLAIQNKMNKHVIIPSDIYVSEFIGNCPINLVGSARRYENNGFRYDLQEAVNDTGAININDYSPSAYISGNNLKDFSYTIFGKYDWGSLIIRNYYQKLESCAKTNERKLAKGLSIVKSAPDALFTEVDGTHFFFVGEIGAKQTADKIIQLINVNDQLNKKITEICAS